MKIELDEETIRRIEMIAGLKGPMVTAILKANEVVRKPRTPKPEVQDETRD